MLVRARAPVRIDFSGGWTDVALFAKEEPGAVVNVAINLHSYATVNRLPQQKLETKEYGYKHFKTVEDKTVRIYSADFDIYEEAEEIKQLEYNGNIDLVKAVLKRMNIDCGLEITSGLEITTRSNAPAGSGLGTSAAMGVALIGALSRLSNKILLPYECAEQASAIERSELGILGGKQDHYASSVGGISFMEFMEEEVRVSKLSLTESVQSEFKANLVQENKTEIETGVLTCSACERQYPIINGIPRMLPDNLIANLLLYHSDFFQKHNIKLPV